LATEARHRKGGRKKLVDTNVENYTKLRLGP
jgi:hypothetical protein